MSSGVELRLAGVEDAEAVTAVNVRAWHHAFTDVIDPRDLVRRTLEGELPLVAGLLAPDSPWETRVACVGGRIVGYATIGASEDPDATAETGTLIGLSIDPTAQGAGLGGLLHADAVARLGTRFESGRLWVFEANGLARGMYERHGWLEDPSGVGQESPGWFSPWVRYRRDF